MSDENNPESTPEAGSGEPDIDAEEFRDLFLDEEHLTVSTISEEFEIEEETAEDLLDRLVQSGIIEKKGRRAVKGGIIGPSKIRNFASDRKRRSRGKARSATRRISGIESRATRR